jgi:hypothetical protein
LDDKVGELMTLRLLSDIVVLYGKQIRSAKELETHYERACMNREAAEGAKLQRVHLKLYPVNLFRLTVQERLEEVLSYVNEDIKFVGKWEVLGTDGKGLFVDAPMR